MRIKTVSINGLFGMFNHHIPMNHDQKTTIIYGPNGFGKTTVLKVLNGVMNGKFYEVRNIPFSTFTIEFDDGRSLKIIRSIDSQAKAGQQRILDIQLFEGEEQTQSMRIKPLSHRGIEFPLSAIDSYIPELSRIAPNLWRNTYSGERLSLDDVLERYEHVLPELPKQETSPKEEDWFTPIRQNITVKLIESQRLTRYRLESRATHAAFRPAVEMYSEEVASQIQRRLAEYGALSQKLDRSFPMRLVRGIEAHTTGEVSSESLTAKLVELEQKRSKLREAGLLEKEDERFEAPKTMQDLTQQVLPVYVHDTEEKLAVFDDIAARIETLKQIVNSRFTFKRLDISKDAGFRFFGVDRQMLRVTQLSSGEQHMLVLMAELLFGIKPNSLVLIDEPEISFHVGWQHEFLNDLQKVAQLSDFDILIATHSPQIINNRWDLTVELEAPELVV
jgi:predicted ATP-binding protein involved in virulence